MITIHYLMHICADARTVTDPYHVRHELFTFVLMWEAAVQSGRCWTQRSDAGPAGSRQPAMMMLWLRVIILYQYPYLNYLARPDSLPCLALELRHDARLVIRDDIMLPRGTAGHSTG